MSRRRKHPTEHEEGECQPTAPSRPSIILLASLVVQVLASASVRLLPFGFDHPSELGLDFGHFVCLHSVYFLALLIGMATSILEKRWILTGVQLFFAFVIAGCWLCVLY